MYPLSVEDSGHDRPTVKAYLDTQVIQSGIKGTDDPPPPNFEPGLIVDKDSMVVDRYGVAWFISPSARQIVHAATRLVWKKSEE